MKEIRKISLILIVIMFMFMMVTKVNAESTCIINLEPQKTNISKGEKFVVDVELSNVTAPDGIISFGGTLEYDKNILTFEKMEAQGEWTAPRYNEENGKFAMDRNSATTSNENVLKITFKVKDDSAKTASVSLKNMSSSSLDGNEDFEIENVATFVTIKANSTSGITTSTNTNTNTNTSSGITNTNTPLGSTNTSLSTTTTDSSATKKELPKAGNENYIMIALLGFAVALGIVFFVKSRKIKM